MTPAYGSLLTLPFELLHEMIASPPAADVVCEVDGLSLHQQLEVIRAAWRAA